VSLAGTRIVGYPRHKSLKNGFFIGHIHIITAQKLLHIINQKQQEFILLGNFYKMLLLKKKKNYPEWVSNVCPKDGTANNQKKNWHILHQDYEYV